jgi:hypothetical protein
MSISVLAISFDAHGAAQLAHFWAQALHRTVNDGATEDFASIPVVSRRRDAQDPQDETGREVLGVNEAHDCLRVGPTSEAKYALTAFRVSNSAQLLHLDG